MVVENNKRKIFNKNNNFYSQIYDNGMKITKLNHLTIKNI